MGILHGHYQVDGVKKELIGTQFETTLPFAGKPSHVLTNQKLRQPFPPSSSTNTKAKLFLANGVPEDRETAHYLRNCPHVQLPGCFAFVKCGY